MIAEEEGIPTAITTALLPPVIHAATAANRVTTTTTMTTRTNANAAIIAILAILAAAAVPPPAKKRATTTKTKTTNLPRRRNGLPPSNRPGRPSSSTRDRECSTSRLAIFSTIPRPSCITAMRRRSTFGTMAMRREGRGGFGRLAERRGMGERGVEATPCPAWRLQHWVEGNPRRMRRRPLDLPWRASRRKWNSSRRLPSASKRRFPPKIPTPPSNR
mmetsp:Transcript_12338/g.26587  ORF Transcript_12338/g.26587 Transcript_12338/m.26587 type:complete len:217 (-) Transcript_12338:1426-2076(-)